MQLKSINWGELSAEFRKFGSLSDIEITNSKECTIALGGSYDDWLEYLRTDVEGLTGLSNKSAREYLETVRNFCEQPNYENKSAVHEYSERFKRRGCFLDINSDVATFQYNVDKKAWESQDLLDESRNSVIAYKLTKINKEYVLQRLAVYGQNKTRPFGPTTTVTEYSKSYRGKNMNCSGIFPFVTKKRS